MNESENKTVIGNGNLKIEMTEYPKCDCGGILVPYTYPKKEEIYYESTYGGTEKHYEIIILMGWMCTNCGKKLGWNVMIIKIGIILLMLLSTMLLSGCITLDEMKQNFCASGINVTITDCGWEEGSKVHHYIYPTDAGYFLNLSSSYDNMGCVGKNVTVGGTSVYYDNYYKRNEMVVKWIIVNGRVRGWSWLR